MNRMILHPFLLVTFALDFVFASGVPLKEKLLIIHADDIGMSHSVNRASFAVMKAGLVRSGSVMVPCPWILEALQLATESPELDLGVHLTLNSEWRNYRWAPVSPAALVPGLIDPQGYLWRDTSEIVSRATDAEVEQEMRAQIERALALGFKPSHLDSHMGTLFARPGFLKAYLKLAQEFSLKGMLPRWSPEVETTLTRLGFPAAALKPIALEAERQGLVTLDQLVLGVVGASLEDRRRSYEQVFRNLKPGVTQVIIHPGISDEELNGITNSAPARDADHKIFSDPATKTLLDALNIRVISWRDL